MIRMTKRREGERNYEKRKGSKQRRKWEEEVGGGSGRRNWR